VRNDGGKLFRNKKKYKDFNENLDEDVPLITSGLERPSPCNISRAEKEL
jgi:hypothetical protein